MPYASAPADNGAPPQGAAETTPAAASGKRPIPLPSDGIGSSGWWKGQIAWSEETRTDLLNSLWRRNARAYEDQLDPPRPDGIRVNIEYEKTEQKRHQLFYRLPAIKLRAAPRTVRDAGGSSPDGLKKSIAIFREVLNQIVGPGHANVKPTMDELIFDVLCPSGISACLVGYERHVDGTRPVETGRLIEDPNAAPTPGAVLDLRPKPLIAEVVPMANVVDEQYFVSRISPAELLIPVEFRGSDYSRRADFLGHGFKVPRAWAKARGWALPEGNAGGSSDEAANTDRITELKRQGDSKDLIRCRQIFYFAQRIDPACKHPKKIRRIVFVEGVPDPVVHEDCRDQRWDDSGRLTGGIESLPIKVLTLRYVSDKPFPPSDCSMTKRQSDELAEFRTQQVVHRRKAAPQRWININAVADDKTKQAILDKKHYDDIPTTGRGDELAGEISRPSYPQENWATNHAIADDVNRAWALIDPAPSTTSGTTATEIASVERATATRLSGERERVVGQFYVEIVEALAQLVQLYADREDYVEIVGEDGARVIEAWDRETIKGRYLFSAIPDSSMPPDAQADRDLALNRYNLLANDPFINREQLVRDTIEAYDGDPDRLVRVPDEQIKPEAPRMSLSISGKDLDPLSPQYANVAAVLAAMGIEGLAAAAPAPMADPALDAATGPAAVVDRERLRMAEADNADQRAGGLVGV